MPSPATSSSPIATARLLLEPVRSEFAPALFTHMNDWEVMRWLASPPWPYGLTDMEGWIDRASRARLEGRDLDMTIMLSGLPIGCIGVTGLDLDPVLGYWLARPFWGRGYMSEAAAAFVDCLFSDGHSFLASGVLAGNTASLRIQKKLGFRVVNERYIHARPHGRQMPHLDTVLGRTYWSRLRRAA
ncbi:Protein N-acetyltransferase, RimJ/RimL family [Rhizobiales bacterium GAS191]|jgi:RimJ/RimL family protein N-acetyltransferase|nr:Protein N-acetyltransferase, RimJ/RimL family [Rhizobiales bacterium GAS188]SEC67139.1 Protein N-acetyltransferase, RimJ/RimL family [Rhizobiales bacterium GAS191]